MARSIQERKFDAHMIPNANAESRRIEAEYARVIKDIQKNADKIVDEKDRQIRELLRINAQLSQERTEAKNP